MLMGKKPSRPRRNNGTQEFGSTPEGIMGVRMVLIGNNLAQLLTR